MKPSEYLIFKKVLSVIFLINNVFLKSNASKRIQNKYKL